MANVIDVYFDFLSPFSYIRLFFLDRYLAAHATAAAK
jgi:2-hydroxychromene-2-carboxylate isomerase